MTSSPFYQKVKDLLSLADVHINGDRPWDIQVHNDKLYARLIAEGLFVLERWHSFGPDYDRILMRWFDNFHNNWKDIEEKYGERFYPMWKFYLLSCAGSFRARMNQLWQIVFSPEGVAGGYFAPR